MYGENEDYLKAFRASRTYLFPGGYKVKTRKVPLGRGWHKEAVFYDAEKQVWILMDRKEAAKLLKTIYRALTTAARAIGGAAQRTHQYETTSFKRDKRSKTGWKIKRVITNI